jgi:hypothetical protein
MNLEMWRHKHGGFINELNEELARYRKGEISRENLSPFAKESVEDLPPPNDA